ncbi:AMP-binding protein, partial [candidate division KSB1 bacterium]|nr:AMP-binding protein [candidate division KSB1 bacterium]
MERAIVLESEGTAQATARDLSARSRRHSERTAIIAHEGTFTYGDLLTAARQVASALLEGTTDLNEKRVAFLIPASFNFVAVLWGIWQAGGIAVPLAVSHPRTELEYALTDAGADIVVAAPEFADTLRPLAEKLACRFCLTTDIFSTPAANLPRIAEQRRALILYTSGTTSKPKGVVTTHRNIQAQVTTLISAWAWRTDDRILLVLPLHHVHGLINVLTCALWAGAACELLPQFNAKTVWEKFLTERFTLFMAVPTIYTKLIAEWENSSKAKQAAMSAACARMRLMVSGSAALPVSVLAKWRAISGHVLLERYGMTETGMILSNPMR